MYIFYNFCDWFCLVFLILYFWESNVYPRFLILLFSICYQFCTFKNLIFCIHFHLGMWLLAWLLSPVLTLPFLPQVTSISSLPLLFSTKLCESLWVFQPVESTYGIDYWLDSSLPFWLPLFSSWSPVSLSTLLSSPCNSLNLSGCLSLWRIFSPLT